MSTSAANGNNVDYIFTALAESKSLTIHFVHVADTDLVILEMLAAKAQKE